MTLQEIDQRLDALQEEKNALVAHKDQVLEEMMTANIGRCYICEDPDMMQAYMLTGIKKNDCGIAYFSTVRVTIFAEGFVTIANDEEGSWFPGNGWLTEITREVFAEKFRYAMARLMADVGIAVEPQN